MDLNMEYKNMIRGRFLRRPNRFIAHVEIDGKEEICHVKNTGRCRELLQEGAEVWCQVAENPDRKTKYDLIAVRKGEYLINMDSQAPNAAVGEWLRKGGLGPVEEVKAESKFGNSRFDFFVKRNGRGMYLEVKGVTLELGGVCRFPDAPTDRGSKHLWELIEAKKQGFDAMVIFVVQMKPVKYLEPNDGADPAFGAALREAHAAGVEVLAVDCHITESTMEIADFVEVRL